MTDINLRILKVPTPQDEVKHRPLAGRQVAYVDARYVMDKLDDLVGPENWSYSWELITLPTEIHPGAIHGKLTVCGVTKEDVGEYEVGKMAAVKTGVSDAFKRCAVHFGIGRDLYSDDYGKRPVAGETKPPAPPAKKKSAKTPTPPKRDMSDAASPAQIKFLEKLAIKEGMELPENITKQEASKLIKKLSG